MKKVIKYALIILVFMVICISDVKADKDKNIVNLYLFYSNSCPHCTKEKKDLEELKLKYTNLRVYMYEIHTIDGSNKLKLVEEYYDFSVKSIPFTIIGSKHYNGYSSSAKSTFEDIIEYYSSHSYIDEIGELLGIEDLPKYETNEEEDIEEYLDNKYVIDVPIVGSVNLKNLTLPVITVAIGLLDGFNPCAMWVLLFLISMLIGSKDKKRMWILGLTFIIISALIYFLFMMAWLNITSYLSAITLVKIAIGLIAIAGGIFNIYSYFKTKSDGCVVVEDKKRNKIFNRIRKFTTEKNFLLAFFGIIVVAISVNLIELLCSAGLPVTYIEILKLNTTNSFEYVIYILFYVLFFMLDDIVVFTIAMLTLNVKGISTKYGRLSHLIGGIILVLIGLLLLFKSEWLMFNFM